MGRKRSILTIHKKIAKDNARTIAANSPGGRYYKPTVTEKIRSAQPKPGGSLFTR